MCGIAGLWRRDGAPVDVDLLEAMTAAQFHRGPDDGGCFAEGAVGIGNRRLSIIDPAGGHQPMANDAETVWIVYNGAVYNFRQLKRELEARGHRFRSSCDTEVILRLYEEYGVDAVGRLRGMFAFAIWDGPRGRLLLARDQVGIKPLYYHDDGRQLAFASEIRPLLLRPEVGRRLSPTALNAFLSFSYVPGADTIFEGVRRLPPGHLMLCEKGRVAVRPYWQLAPLATRQWDEERYATELRQRLEGAVDSHLIADVPVGVFLSGGLDSSSIVALLAGLGRRDTPTFSVGFSDGAGYFDESADARAVAEHFGMAHQPLLVRSDIAGMLPEIVRSLEEPLGDPSTFLTYLISHAAREHVKVALTGMGGDELFAGYRRYVGAQLVERLRRFPGPRLGALLAAAAERIPATDGTRVGYQLTMLRRLLQAARAPHPDAYISMVSYFTPAMKARLYAPALRATLAEHEPAEAFRAHFRRPAEGDLLARIFCLDLKTFLADNLLLFSDRMSMAASLELRVPFLDLDLVELAATLPADLRIRGGETKYLLRRAMGPLLPPLVLRKPKQGFTAPVGQWLRGELRGYADDLLSRDAVAARGLFDPDYVATLLAEHRTGRREWGHQLFSLMIFELWGRTFIDSRNPISAAVPDARWASSTVSAAGAGRNGHGRAPRASRVWP